MTTTPTPYSIKSHVITGATPGPHLLITGGTHGDEFEPMAAIRQLMSLITPRQLRGKLTLVPVLNEPAYHRSHRTADDGLDLARTFPGKADGSITQRIAHAATPLIASADLYMDLHTGGTGLSVMPLSGYAAVPDQRILNIQRRMAHAFNLPIVWGADPTLNGRTLSAARDAGVPGIYCEYLGSATCSPDGVDAYVQGCLNVMAEFDMIHHTRPPNRVKHFIEDTRPNAGHLQICHPAPIDGYFEPHFKLGDRVRKGEVVGTITDVLGTEKHNILAEHTGMVIVLHTYPRVAKNTGVLVVLEM